MHHFLKWNIWPNPNDDFQLGSIHIISLDEVDLNADMLMALITMLILKILMH